MRANLFNPFQYDTPCSTPKCYYEALVGRGGGTGFNLPSWVTSILGFGGGWGFCLVCSLLITSLWVSEQLLLMSLVDESLEFNSFLGGELVTVESESTTEIIQKID